MKIRISSRVNLALLLAIFLLVPAAANEPRVWRITSPDHEQTFAYGTEQNQVWAQRGSDGHLVLLLNYTNDPFVDRDHPREYDNFTFAFPSIRLGKDGRTYYYHASNGHSVPVAAKRPDFFGIDEIKLLSNANLEIFKPHGYLTLTVEVED